MPRPVGEWTLDKLKILSDYLPAYLQATTTARERIYIDGFAGPGTNVLPGGRVVPGSPLIALRAQAKNGTRFSRLLFIEQDPQAVAELRSVLASEDVDGRAKVIQGDINIELPAVAKTLPALSPTFVLLDPAGIEPLWDTVVAVAQRKTELLINFPLGMSINRNAVRSPNKIDAYFGTIEWRALFHARGTGRARRLIDLYKTRLRELGYAFTVDDDRLVKTAGNRRLYYLLFVSKVDVAKRIMTWVFEQPDAKGQSQMKLDI